MASLKISPHKNDIAIRAALLLGLWLGFWVLSFSLAAGLFAIGYFQFKYGIDGPFGLIAIVAGLSLAVALRPREIFSFNRKKDEPPIYLARQAAPHLYRLVDDIGAKFGLSAPVNIRIIGQASAYISADRNWFGKIKSLEVGFGLPLFYLLSKTELSTVIAHEFGHFARGDIALTAWVYRTRISMGNTVSNLEESMFFLDAPFRFYGKWFLKHSRAVSRVQEFNADLQSAQLFGAAPTRSALEKIHHIDAMWAAYLDEELFPAINHGTQPPIFEGFRLFNQAGEFRQQVKKSIHRNLHIEKSIYDTHPSLEERVANLVPHAQPDFPLPEDCFALLGNAENVENLWYSTFKNVTLKKATWDEYGREIIKPQIEKRFKGSWMDPQQLPLSELIAIVADTDTLWQKLKPEGVSLLSAEAKKIYVFSIVEDWIIACLCAAGFEPHVYPGRQMVLIRGCQEVVAAQLLTSAKEKTLQPHELENLMLC